LASAQREAVSLPVRSLSSEERARFLKRAETELLEEGAIAHVDQS
jgi:hypothetical protein